MTEKSEQVITSRTAGQSSTPSMKQPENNTLMQNDREDASKRIADLDEVSPGLTKLQAFFSSGLFFMLFGTGMLFFAYKTMSGTHSSFTFVIVVVGVAILLYGTGTQGAGEFRGEHLGNRYRAAIAGGAGVLAFAIGIGIVLEHEKIKKAFQVEQKYFRLPLQAADDGVTDLSNYAAIAMINGARVPTALRGDRIEIYVPYLAGQATGAVLQVSGVLYRREPASKQQASKEFSDKIVFHEKHLVPEGGFEFPRWEENEKITISVRDTQSIQVFGFQ